MRRPSVFGDSVPWFAFVAFHKKNAPKKGSVFAYAFGGTYSDTIASLGQTPAQVPQSMHLSGSMT